MSSSTERLTCAEVGELSGNSGPLIVVRFTLTAPRPAAHTGNTMFFNIPHSSLSASLPSLTNTRRCVKKHGLYCIIWPCIDGAQTCHPPQTHTHTHTDSHGIPHGEVNVAVGQHCDDSHGGFQPVSVGGKAWSVIGQTHTVPLPCKLNTHTHTCKFTLHRTYINLHEVFFNSQIHFCSILVCTTLILTTMWLLTAYYVVLCTMFWILNMLCTYMFCLLMCLHRGSERNSNVYVLYTAEISIKLTLTIFNFYYLPQFLHRLNLFC